MEPRDAGLYEQKGYVIQELIVPVNYLGGSGDHVLSLISDQAELKDDGNHYALFSYRGKFYIDDLDFRISLCRTGPNVRHGV